MKLRKENKARTREVTADVALIPSIVVRFQLENSQSAFALLGNVVLAKQVLNLARNNTRTDIVENDGVYNT